MFKTKEHFKIKRYILVLSICVLSLILTPSNAFASSPQTREAQAYFCMDEEGNVLCMKNSQKEMDMASITKIMTAMVALDSSKNLSDKVPVDKVDLGVDAQAAGFSQPQTLTLEQLMEVMLVYSANDAATLIARYCAGSEKAFVEKMNAKAKELGMENTHFKNPHGLEEKGHYSCARDLVIMGKYARVHYPFIAKWTHQPSVTIPVNGQNVTFRTTDYLIGRYQGILGMKTGKVSTGNTFLGAAQRNGITLYSCVLGCPSDMGRFTDTEQILNWGFDRYENKVLADPNTCFGYVSDPYNFMLKHKIMFKEEPSGYVLSDKDNVSLDMFYLTHPVFGNKDSLVGLAMWTQDSRLVNFSQLVLGEAQMCPDQFNYIFF